MIKLFLFMTSIIAFSHVFAASPRSEFCAYECEKGVNLLIFSSQRAPEINGVPLAPNRTGQMTIGQDGKGRRYEFSYTNTPRVRLLSVYEPLLNRPIDHMVCKELPR